MRIALLGNAGSGKSTLARRLADQHSAAILSLDDIAWNVDVVRKPLSESIALLEAFVHSNPAWIVEGCYGDLIEVVLPYCEELIFLNPGVTNCVLNCRQRPWEPEKFESRAAQQAMLEDLIAWVQQYETRTDEFGMQRHRALFDAFAGTKSEHKNLADYVEM